MNFMVITEEILSWKMAYSFENSSKDVLPCKSSNPISKMIRPISKFFKENNDLRNSGRL